MFVPVLRFILNLSIYQNTLPNLCKLEAIFPVLKKDRSSCVGNNRSVAILN
jgi:hypothetical protein